MKKNIIWNIFIIFCISMIISGFLVSHDTYNVPCEELSNITIGNLPARCLNYYK